MERAEYASGTAVVYYLMKSSNITDAEAKYLDIYLPGQKTPRVRFEVTKEERPYGGSSKLIGEYPNVLDYLTKVE